MRGLRAGAAEPGKPGMARQERAGQQANGNAHDWYSPEPRRIAAFANRPLYDAETLPPRFYLTRPAFRSCPIDLVNRCSLSGFACKRPNELIDASGWPGSAQAHRSIGKQLQVDPVSVTNPKVVQRECWKRDATARGDGEIGDHEIFSCSLYCSCVQYAGHWDRQLSRGAAVFRQRQREIERRP